MGKPWEKAAAAQPRPAKPWEKAAQSANAPGALEPMGGASGEWDLSKFEALPRPVQPSQANAPNPITTAMRQSQDQVNADFAARKAEEQRRAEAASRSRRESAAAFGGGMDLMPTEDAAGNVQPGSPVDMDIGKGLVTLPARIERGVVGAGQSIVNLPSDVADFLGSVNKPEYRSAPVPRADFSAAKIPIAPELDSVTGNLAEGLAQFLVSRKLVGSAAPGGGTAAQLGKDAIATGVGFDGTTGRVADMLDPNVIPEGPLRDYANFLRTQPEDSPLVGRFKNLLEDMTFAGPMVAPHAAIRGGQAVMDAINPQAVPVNAAGRDLRQVAPSPAPAPTAPVAPPQARQGAVPGAGQAAPQPAPVQTMAPPSPPPIQPAAAAPPGAPPVQPPAVVAQPAAGAPPPGVMTPVPTPPAGGGWATRSFNALPQKSREAILRAMQNSGMDRQTALGAIRDLDTNVRPDGNTQFEFELIKRWGGVGPGKYPDLQANLTNMGADFAIHAPKHSQVFGVTTSRDGAQQVMNTEVANQLKAEGQTVVRKAEDLFGAGSNTARETLDNLTAESSREYNRILNPRRPYGNTRNPVTKRQIDVARQQLADYLKRPEVMDNVPEWVRQKVMLQLSKDLRGMKFPENERALMAQGELASLFTPDGELVYSPAAWRAMVDLYPTQVGHSVQSGFATAAREARRSADPEVRTWAAVLDRRRGRSAVRANAANPDNRGFGLLHLQEQATPGYKENRLKYGNIMGADEPVEMAQDFMRFANDEVAMKEFMDTLEELTPLQREAVENQITTQIRQAVANKVETIQPYEVGQSGTLPIPNLTAISKQPFLNALEKAFGAKGKELADTIRYARANVDNLGAIHSKYKSGTPQGIDVSKNARQIYEHPLASDNNVIDKTVGMLSSAGIASAVVPGAQAAAVPLLAAAVAKGAHNALKATKRTSPAERTAVADWLFKSRAPGSASAPAVGRLPGPRGPSPIGRIGNIVTGAGVGGAVGYGASGGDPNAAMMGALGGAGAGVARQAMRARASAKSLIPEVRAPRVGREGGPIARMGFGGGGDAVGRKGSPTSMGGPSANELRISESINEMRSRGMSNENISSRLELNGIKIAPDRIDHFAKMTPATGSGRYKGNVISLNTRRAQGENKSGLPSGTSAAIGAIGGGAYGALGPLQDMDGDGDKDAADRQAMIAAYGMGGLSSGVAIGALKGAGRSVIGAMGRGGKGAQAALADAEKILADPRVASQLSPEQYQPLYDAISKRMQEIQSKGLDKTQQGYAEVNRLNGLLMNYFKNPDGTQNLGKTLKRAEATDPDRVMRVQAGRAVNDVEDGVVPRQSNFATKDGTTYTVHFDETPGGVDVSFNAETGPRAKSGPLVDEFKPLGNASLAEATEVFRNVERAIKDDIATSGAERYVLQGRTSRQREVYAQMAKTKQPPEGYRWEMQERPGQRSLLTLVREERPTFKVNQQTFGGINAKTADKVALARAERMDKEGASREEIWDATGWFKGVDGKWRFEIDDSKSGFSAATKRELETKGVARIGKTPEGVALKTAFNHSAAGNAYPQYSWTGVRGEIRPGAKTRGGFTGSPYGQGRPGSMGFKAPDINEARSVVLHEGQHMVQDVEGFASGGSPGQAALERVTEIDSQIAKAKDDLLEALDGGEGPIVWSIRDRISQLQAERAAAQNGSGAIDKYNRLAGETEARNVQTRRDFTPEERRANPPWKTQDVPDDQQIVRFGGGRAESRAPKIGALKTAPMPKRIAEKFNQEKLSPELRAALAENAAKSAGEQLSPMEVARSIDRAPEMYGMLTPYLRDGTELSDRVSREIGKLSETANADPVNVGLRKLGAEATLTKAEQALKEARSKQGGATRKLELQRARNFSNPNAKTLNEPFVEARATAERATLEAERVRNEAKATLDKFNLEVLNFENTKAAAEKELQRISEAMGPKAPKVGGLPSYSPMSPRKIGAIPPKAKAGTPEEATKMHELVYSPAGAKLLAQIQSGEVVPKPYSTAHKMLSYLAQHPVQGIGAGLALAGSAGGYAAILSEADQANRDAMIKSGTMRDPNLPEPENPNAWNWEKQTQRPQFVETLQLNLQQVGYRIADDGHMYRKDGKETNTTKAIKHWQWSQGQEPTGILTEDQYYTLQEQAQEARRTGGAGANATRATPSLQPMSQ